jgi:hypothetical protein
MEKEIEKNESNNAFFPFTINKDIDTWIPQENRITFQKAFSYLRKKLQIKLSRKTYIDSILKKCKARFFKALNDILKQCVKMHIKKFPQSFITNISIEYNKIILEFTVQELYKTFNSANINLEECFEKNECYKGKENYLKFIIYSKISDLYLLYIQSNRYKREIQYIKNNIGIKMFLLYELVSDNYVNYYLFSKPHFCKKQLKDEDKKISIFRNNSTYEESKKSTIISLFIDESENENESNKLDKKINN